MTTPVERRFAIARGAFRRDDEVLSHPTTQREARDGAWRKPWDDEGTCERTDTYRHGQFVQWLAGRWREYADAWHDL